MSDFTIAHATDLDPEGGIAFAHGVALARDAHARLVSVHANPREATTRRDMPDAAALLSSWGQSAEGVRHEALVHECCDDPVDTLLDALNDIGPDLLVVGHHRKRGLERFFGQSVSAALALNARVPTLFLPIGGHGFVSEETGELSVKRVLVPVRDESIARPAVEQAADLCRRLGVDGVELILLHVGRGDVLDSVEVPQDRGWSVRRVGCAGELEAEIARRADLMDVDLVVMATQGHDSLADMLRGSHTENVVRLSEIPVLAVPV
ncbi:MAG: universal stress protein [Myxococcota bacterium]